MAAILRIILGEDYALKLSLPNGIPNSVEHLKEEITRQFGLTGNFRLQYRDIEFDNEFVNLTMPSEIKDKSTVKVVYLPVESSVFSVLPHPRREMSVLYHVRKLIQTFFLLLN